MKTHERKVWTMLIEQYVRHPHGSSPAERIRRVEHAERVLAFSQLIADELEDRGYPLDRRLLEDAAILHDIQKFKSDKRHPQLAAKAIKKRNQDWKKKRRPFSREERIALDGVISAHKGDFAPPYDCVEEAAILRMADKLDKVWRAPAKADFKEAKRVCKEKRKDMKEYFEFWDEMEFYEDLKEICKGLIRAMKEIKGFS